ncbi:MAG: hypothetical protein ACI4PM_01985 [Butyricicoccus sp.]
MNHPIPETKRKPRKLLFSRIEEQQKENDTLKAENQALSDAENTWSDRNILNALMRSYAYAKHHNNYGYAWSDFYKQLAYSEGIDVRRRKDDTGSSDTLIHLIRDGDELGRAVKCAAAMCKNVGINVGKVINEVNAAVTG